VLGQIRLCIEKNHREPVLVHENGRSLEFRVYPGTSSGTRIGVIRDVTQRRKAEKSMHIMAIRDRVFLDSVPDIIFLKDKKFRYLISNKANNALLHLTNVDVIGHTDFYIMDESTAKACRASDEQVLREKIIVANEEIMDGHILRP
jgi:PAS domain-containing protein